MNMSPGTPYPLGVTHIKEGVNFAVFCETDQDIFLCLFSKNDLLPEEILIPYRTGKIRHLLISNLNEVFYAYAYRIKYHEKKDPLYFLDPYATALNTTHIWGDQQKLPYAPLALLSHPEPFDWGSEEKPPNIPVNELVLYEMHVRGFTIHESSGVKLKGSFLGMIEKIPHLIDLGINAVELLPIFEFNEQEYKAINPETKQQLYQYWGYSSVNFFSPMNRFALSEDSCAALKEFKMLVKELHKNGIEVILDVVFNHTAEGNSFGPAYSFKGLANDVYYITDSEEGYRNYSGCGNTLNCNHPIVRQLILKSLHYWVAEMHVDGFRFDLASVFYRGQNGEVLQNPPLLDAISEDPILANVKLIAEPWDVGGLYQVGSFYPESKRWHEWNGRYRDCMRKFIKGDKGLKGEFATRLSGSQDLFDQRRSPSTSVNFITSHDGFTLQDLVSYNEKHNAGNAEDNRDGSNENDSWNCGVEGASSDSNILVLRERQMRNFLIALMVSQGIPMLLMGDEYGHTRYGNNNAWCQDNEINWFLWDVLKKNAAFYRFCKGLTHFRRREPLLKRKNFLRDEDIEWHGLEPSKPQWDKDDKFIAFSLIDERDGQDLYVAFNACNHELDLTLPEKKENKSWHWIANSSLPSPHDFYEEETAPKVEAKHYKMASHSALLLKAY